jgi:hypothetical protein
MNHATRVREGVDLRKRNQRKVRKTIRTTALELLQQSEQTHPILITEADLLQLPEAYNGISDILAQLERNTCACLGAAKWAWRVKQTCEACQQRAAHRALFV